MSATDDLFRAVKRGTTVREVKALIAAGADLTATDEKNQTVLMAASDHHASDEVIGALIRAGADVNATDSYGTTALLLAAMSVS